MRMACSMHLKQEESTHEILKPNDTPGKNNFILAAPFSSGEKFGCGAEVEGAQRREGGGVSQLYK